jgi:DNA-binding MarR family transcriptional regulator
MQNLSLLESNSQPFIIDNDLSFNFNDHTKLNLTTFSSLTETKSYTPITSCVLEHIIATTNLTKCEKLYYLLADSLSIISKNKGYGRYCALPSEDWAEYLGCSRSLVFTMQRSLVKKGYFIINKDFDEIGRNNRNLITSTLPTSVFNHLNEKYPDRVGDHTSYNPLSECKRSYLDRTKLFIKLNYNLLKLISSNEYTNPRQKIMWLGFYTRGYKNYMLGKEEFNVSKYSYNDDSSFSFITSYKELADLYSCNIKNISKSIRALEKLGFIKTQNIYIRKKCGSNDDCRMQERQDQSLWKITLSLPKDCITELEKVKDRSNLKLKNIKDELVAIENNVAPKLIEDCLILGGIKFNLNLEQSSLLKSLIDGDSNDNGLDDANVNCNDNIDSIIPLPNNSCDESYIDSVMEELNIEATWKVENKLEKSFIVDDSKFLSDEPKTLSTSSSLEELDEKIEKNDGIKSDPHVAKSGLLYNKDLISKIKDIKSNLGATPKVFFNDFLKRFKKDESDENVGSKNKDSDKEFNIHSELIREKLKILPKDKADKARKFAYSLVSKGLTSGYAANLSKHELAKQIIHHAATWKPTKLGFVSREKEIDTALSVAWKKIVGGTWQVPLELAKAEILQYEFNAYRRKYQESGVLSHESKALESDVNSLLGGWCDLTGKITGGVKVDNLREWEVSRDSEVAVYSSTKTSLGIRLEDNGYEERFNRSEYPTFDCSFAASSFGHKGSERVDYEFPEIEGRDKLLNVDLSHIHEDQRYLKVTPSDNDSSVKLETINGKEYFVKLKELEMNERGEFVMTLRSIPNKCFIDLSENIQDNSLLIKEEWKGLTSQVDLNLNGSTDLQAMATNNRTVKIDEVIGNLLKTIRVGN